MPADNATSHRPIQPLKSIEAAAQTAPSDPQYFQSIYVPQTGGVFIDQHTALTYAAVYAAIRAISEDTAGLGHAARRQLAGGGREDLPDHPASRVLAVPNDEMSGYTLRESMQSHALSWGNGYAEIERNARGRPVALYLLTPDRVTPRRIEGRLVYQVRNAGGFPDTWLESMDILHLHGLGFDGLIGYSVINMARRTIGMAVASDEYAASTFKNRSRPDGVLKHPGELKGPAADRLRESWEEFYRGPKNAGKTAVLENGMEYVPLTMPNTDMQFIENRKFQIEEVARWYRIPPHKLAHIVQATFNNIEEQNINYVQDCLLPWVNRWESECERKLLAPQERGRIRIKLNLNTLLRGAMEKRTQSYIHGRQWGWLSPNDIRGLEDLDPLPADVGDIYLVPANMMPADLAHEFWEQKSQEPQPAQQQQQETRPSDATSSAADSEPPQSDDAGGPVQNLQPILFDAIRRCIDREVNHASRAPENCRTVEQFAGWSRRFYSRHMTHCVEALRPVADVALAALEPPPADDQWLVGFVRRMNQATFDTLAEQVAIGAAPSVDVSCYVDQFKLQLVSMLNAGGEP